MIDVTMTTPGAGRAQPQAHDRRLTATWVPVPDTTGRVHLEARWLPADSAA